MNKYMSLKDHVYNYISEKISNGTLSADEKLNEQQICDELNISRTPVREALIQLASDGYLENSPRKGFKVRNIDEKKTSELYEIIGTLDGLAASLAIDNICDKDIKTMNFLVESMDNAIEKCLFETYLTLQVEFHDIYIYLCDNLELINIITQLKRKLIKKTYTSNSIDNLLEVLNTTNAEHRNIIEFFKKKDKIGVQNYLKQVHWRVNNSNLQSLQVNQKC